MLIYILSPRRRCCLQLFLQTLFSVSTIHTLNSMNAALMSEASILRNFVKCETTENHVNCTIWIPWHVCSSMYVKLLQLCLILWDPMDGSPPDSSSMGFSRQEYWSKSPCPPPGDLPNLGIELSSLASPALACRFFTISTTWEAQRFSAFISCLH